MDLSDQARKRLEEFCPPRRVQFQPEFDLGSIALFAQNISILERNRTHQPFHCQLVDGFMLDDFILHRDFKQSKIA